MLFMIWVHRFNSAACFCLGLPLNLLLIWLLFRRTSKEMGQFSHILVQTCVVDIVLLVLAELVQPVFFMSEGVSYDLLVGPLKFLPNPANHIAFLFWFAAFYFSTEGLSVQFVYRYLTICRKIPIDALKYFGLLSVAFLFDAVLCILLSISSYPDKSLEQVGDPTTNGTTDDNGQTWTVAIRSDTSQPLVLVWFVLLLLSNLVTYALIIFCATRIRTFLSRQIVEFKLNKWAELNGQITKTLLIQALLPALPLAVCTLGVCLCLLGGGASSLFLTSLELLITVPLSWLPVANPMVTILTVRHYRRVCRKACRKAGKTMLSVVTLGQIAQNVEKPENEKGNYNNKTGIYPQKSNIVAVNRM